MILAAVTAETFTALMDHVAQGFKHWELLRTVAVASGLGYRTEVRDSDRSHDRRHIRR
jgi:hypothetical protein